MAYIYLATIDDAFKIGHSIAPDRRMEYVMIDAPRSIGGGSRRRVPRLLHVMACDRAKAVERALHWLFRAKRYDIFCYEWYRLDPADVAWIQAQSEASILAAANAEWDRVQALPRGYKSRELHNRKWDPRLAE